MHHDAHIHRSASPESWPYLPTYAATLDHDINSITLGARYSEHTAFITATAGATYEISMRTSIGTAPLIAGNSGILAITTSATNNMANITFTAATTPTQDATTSTSSVLEYQLLWSSMPLWSIDSNSQTAQSPDGCVTDSSSGVNTPSLVSDKWNGNCIFWTACGAQVLTL
jgi:hypothetical protein